MDPEKDEIFMQFGDSLKGLRNLRKQLYSAADCFESSYNRHNHKQLVVETSREYVIKALVSTVDHLGSTANKLNKFLDEKATQFSATNFQLSLIHQRLSTIQGLSGVSHNMFKIQHTNYHKHHLLSAETLESEILSRQIINKRATSKQMDRPSLMKKESRKALSPSPTRFSFTTQKGPERRSVSPLRYLTGSVIKRSVSPTPSLNKWRIASEPRRAVSAGRKRHDSTVRTTKETEESYTKRSKHLFKALLSLHHSKKETALPSLSTSNSLPETRNRT
ncbi:hypothetical protein ACS0TY_001544 [Phlomoides rotata]